MTDDPTTSSEKPLIVSMPTGDAFLELAAQVETLQNDVEHLQANSLALPADDGSDDDPFDVTTDDLAQLSARIDRHRSEIENVKRVINQIIKFLGTNGIPQTPAADGNTITGGTQ